MTTATQPCVVLTRATFPELIARLQRRYEVRPNQEDHCLSMDALHARLADADAALVTGSDRVDRAFVDAAPRLRAVCSISVGYNHIDLDACARRGVVVTNTPDVLTDTTADMGFALLMAAARRVTESERWLRDGHWQRWTFDQFLGADLHHSTLGILGMGRIGQAIARRGAGFSMRVLYHNRTRLPTESEQSCGAQYVDFPTLLCQSDHLLLTLPYTLQNHHLIDAAALARMKPTATLVNISRGGLVDEAALAAALHEGRLAAAGLDVYEQEPTVHPALLAQTRVALTPHIGSASAATRMAMARLAIDNLDAVFDGRAAPNQVHPAGPA